LGDYRIVTTDNDLNFADGIESLSAVIAFYFARRWLAALSQSIGRSGH
jgi:hypothetical protein